MIRFLPSILRFNNWPIWFKLIAAFLLAALIPAMTALVLVQNTLDNSARADLREYVTERGTDRQANVAATFDRTRQTVNAFVQDRLIVQYLLMSRLPLNDASFNVPPGLEQAIRNDLIGSRLFDRVIITSTDGTIITSEDTGSAINTGDTTYAAGANFSRHPAFTAAETASLLGEFIRLVIVSEADGPQVYISGVGYDAPTNTPIAFVLARVNIAATIYRELADTSPYRETYSYLLTHDDMVIADPDIAAQARASTGAIPLRVALSESGSLEHEVHGESAVAHYGPIRATNLVIVTEALVGVNTLMTRGLVLQQGFLLLSLVLICGIIVALLTNWGITPALLDLQSDMQAVMVGDYERPIGHTDRSDEIGLTAQTYLAMRERMLATYTDLRTSVDARVRDLQATQEVSRFAASQRDVQRLMNQVVLLIVDLFPNIYHAQIFLIDDSATYALLRASTGKAGQALLARGHRLAVGSNSVIGTVTEEGRVVVARDIGSSTVHRANEFLPETRAELAIPLRLGTQIIGALDVQSTESDSFTEEQISLLQTMADQIAIAIENARLYQESLRQLMMLNASNQDQTRDAWRDYVFAQRSPSLVSHAGLRVGGEDIEAEAARETAMREGEAIVGTLTERSTYPVAVPIRLRGQVLGVIEWEMPADTLTADTVALAEELATRLAVSLDNARLFQESRIATNRERLVNEITTRLTAQTDVNEILQTAVREIGQALRVPDARVHLHTAALGALNGNGSD